MSWAPQVKGLAIAAAVLAFACRTTLPGTHVEIIDKGGEKVYLTGAANQGMNKDMACSGAIQRAVAAIALRFAQDNDDIAEEVAEAVGTDDGEVFLQRFAKADALDAAVQDLDFDPMEHVCMATVRWKPPIFVKEAVQKYAEKLKTQELGSSAPASPSPAAPVAPSAPPAAVSTAPATPPPPPTSVAPPAPAPAAPVAPACTSERSSLSKTLKASQKALDDYNECLRRTKNDETICHRYKLYVEEAKKKEGGVGQKLADCLNAGLSVTLRGALTRELPGHAGVSVETRGDGTLILWTFSPVEQTAFALEVSSSGTAVGRAPLAANQVVWVRHQLGL
jgi:hypothetical protein